MSTQAEVERYRSTWDIAYGIAVVGASNPRAVAGAIHSAVTLWKDTDPTTREALNPPIRAMIGHLDYLLGYGLGPDETDLRIVQDEYERRWK